MSRGNGNSNVGKEGNAHTISEGPVNMRTTVRIMTREDRSNDSIRIWKKWQKHVTNDNGKVKWHGWTSNNEKIVALNLPHPSNCCFLFVSFSKPQCCCYGVIPLKSPLLNRRSLVSPTHLQSAPTFASRTWIVCCFPPTQPPSLTSAFHPSSRLTLTFIPTKHSPKSPEYWNPMVDLC